MSPRKRSERVLRLVVWGGLAVWAISLGAFYVTRSARAAPGVGDQVLEAGLMGRTMEGGEIPLLPHDSVVAVLAATSECAACRVGVPAYREIAARLKAEGVALRVVVGSDSLAARQYSLLLTDPGVVVWDPRKKLFRSMGVRNVPSLYLVGRDGRLLKMWAPTPTGPQAADMIAGEARAGR